ncbi:Common central domain of tyrosinase [Paragonimus heterotremus]|uniref:Common central domain of tyrosinase n=1 Tax=Paragonimus heterotremus TaxID=100268 RepID=A0A8J4T8F5_9TREM|nr:Common central domain of tyrosinase [Paragonimus heterotremus]
MFLQTTSVVILIFMFHCFLHMSALIPEVCVHNVTRPNAVCCPLDPYNHQVCGGPERGFCHRIATPVEFIPHVFLMDDRLAWPLRFFSYLCQCKGNFFGIACESCWFGWKGQHCDQKNLKIRRDIRSLPEDELNLFKDVYKRSSKWPSGFVILDESTNLRSDPLNKPRFIQASVQYFVAFIHRYGARPTLYKNKRDCQMYGILNFNHDGVVFPTWHRYFQLLWEQMFAKIAYEVHHVQDYMTPYWDFVGLENCDICTDKYVGGKGYEDKDGLHLSRHSPFSNLLDFCLEPDGDNICFGCQAAKRLPTITRKFRTNDFPNQKDVEYVLSLKHYFIPGERDSESCDSFHMALEGYCGRPGANATFKWMHNKIHLMIDGSMCCTATATNDPIFLLMHNFVDKLFNIWLRIYRPDKSVYPNRDVRPGHSRDSFMIGLLPLARNGDMFVDSVELGYDYDDMIIGKYAQNNLPPIVLKYH